MKDPAFLFYPNDYIGGTMGMTFEEKGAYMELLMMQFNRGHMSGHMIGQSVGQLWDKIQDKFIKDENGLWYNERLEDEQNKRKSFTESRRNNKLGTNQHTKKGGHTSSRMENEDVNVDIDKDEEEIENEIPEKLLPYKILANNIVNYFPDESIPKTNTQKIKWLDCLRKLIELDGHTPEDITLIVQTMRSDDFWGGNFLSLLKLRQKDKNGMYFIDRFKIEMKHEHKKTNKEPGRLYPELLNEITQRYSSSEPDQ